MAAEKRRLNVGLIGTGFTGRTHALGFASAPRVFDPPFDVGLHAVADRSDDLAATTARALGFEQATGDWRANVENP